MLFLHTVLVVSFYLFLCIAYILVCPRYSIYLYCYLVATHICCMCFAILESFFTPRLVAASSCGWSTLHPYLDARGASSGFTKKSRYMSSVLAWDEFLRYIQKYTQFSKLIFYFLMVSWWKELEYLSNN